MGRHRSSLELLCRCLSSLRFSRACHLVHHSRGLYWQQEGHNAYANMEETNSGWICVGGSLGGCGIDDHNRKLHLRLLGLRGTHEVAS